MSLRSNLTLAAIVGLSLCWPLRATFGHDFEAVGSLKWGPKRLAYPPVHPVRKIPPGIFIPEFVVGLPNRWAIGQDIRICFVGGSDQLRTQIITVAMQWFQHATLRPQWGGPSGKTCGPNERSEIRIGFGEPGYWSYVGNDSLNTYLLQNQLTSMNLQGFDLVPLGEPRFTGVVLHEFGHALGFEHEHQSPAGGCDNEYDWVKLYRYYQTAYGWNKDKVDQNVRQLMADRSAYAWSQFDPSSIMIYGTDPQFLKKGTKSTCYLHDNNNLSALDIKGAETTYPVGDALQILQSRAAALQKATATLSSGELKESLVRQLQSHETQLRSLEVSK